MKKWIWLLPLGLSLGCLGKPTVQANDPATSNNKPNNPTDVVVDAGQEPEDEFDLNETWTNLITDGGPLQDFYEDGGTLSCLPEECIPRANKKVFRHLHKSPEGDHHQ